MKYILNNKEVEIVKTEADDDIIAVIDAYYVESEKTLSETDMTILSENYADELYEEWYSTMVDHASDMDLER
jgi:hypothetical protein